MRHFVAMVTGERLRLMLAERRNHDTIVDDLSVPMICYRAFAASF